jgi:hypothetical protein
MVGQRDSFDDPDWIYEIKHDGFRALIYESKAAWYFYPAIEVLANLCGIWMRR